MSTQISLKLSDKMLAAARKYAKSYGYENLQDFIRELLREQLFERERVSGLNTYKASEASLAKNWLRKEENEAWKHLQPLDKDDTMKLREKEDNTRELVEKWMKRKRVDFGKNWMEEIDTTM